MLPEVQFIETMTDLECLCKQLTGEVILGIDTEADSFHHYVPKVCLIQIATNERLFLIDPLAIPTMDPLRPLFASRSTKKILHGADYDVRSLCRDFGMSMHNLFDTMVALQFMGEKEPSLAAAVEKRFGVTLDKKYQKANWSKRPLSQEMILYAANDTAHLIKLYDQLERELRSKGRLSWVEEECQALCQLSDEGLCSAHSMANERIRQDAPGHSEAKKAPPIVPTALFRRFKGAGKMVPRDLAVLESLLQFRERKAMGEDRPPFKLFSNRVIQELVRTKPPDREALVRVPDLPTKAVKRYGRGMLKAIQQGLAWPEDRLPSFPKSRRPPPDRAKQARLQRLKSWRSAKAKELELQTGLICNNQVLDALAERPPENVQGLNNIPTMRAWQRKAFGQEIIGVVRQTR